MNSLTIKWDGWKTDQGQVLPVTVMAIPLIAIEWEDHPYLPDRLRIADFNLSTIKFFVGKN